MNLKQLSEYIQDTGPISLMSEDLADLECTDERYDSSFRAIVRDGVGVLTTDGNLKSIIRSVPGEYIKIKDNGLGRIKDRVFRNKIYGRIFYNSMSRFLIDRLTNVASSIFGEDRVDATSSRYGSCVDLTIHYPELTISNNKNKSHTLRDFYVRIKFPFTHNGDYKKAISTIKKGEIKYLLEMPSISGFKETYTENEWNTGYCHSHIPCIYPEFQNFCLGEAIDLIATMTNVSTCKEEEFDDLVASLIFIVDGMVEYESLEGGPHAHISNILNGNRAPASLDYVSRSHVRNRILKLIYDKKVKVSIDYRMLGVNKVLYSAECDEVKDAILEDFKNSKNSSLLNSIVCETADGDLFRLSTPESIESERKDILEKIRNLYEEHKGEYEVPRFKGRRLIMNVISSREVVADNVNEVLHYDVVKTYNRIINRIIKTLTLYTNGNASKLQGQQQEEQQEQRQETSFADVLDNTAVYSSPTTDSTITISDQSPS